MENKLQKGNTLLIIVALVLVVGIVGLGGYFIYNLKILNPSTPGDNYALETVKVEGVAESKSTSDKISLNIISPKNNDIVKSRNVVVAGKTTSGAEVFINDQYVKADLNGNFSLTITLDEGENILVVAANDEEGNVTEQNFSVNVQTF